jgi:hypothetical protein
VPRSNNPYIFNGKEKRCHDCCKWKPLRFFHRKKTRDAHLSSGWRSRCKKCHTTHGWNRIRERIADSGKGIYVDCDNCIGLVSVKRPYMHKCIKE